MTKLSVDVAGIELKYPLLVSAGPLTRDGKSILKIARQKGVGAVTTKTIYPKPEDTPRPCIIKTDGGVLNMEFADIGREKWLHEFEIAERCGVPLIASVLGKNETETGELAVAFQDAGAAMIEIPVSARVPLDSLSSLIRVVKSAIEIPLIVKFGPDIPDIPLYIKKFQSAGADVVSGINTYGPCLAIDIETAKPSLGSRFGYGYMSGPAIKPLALRCIAEAAMSATIPVFGGGGVISGKDAIEMLMVGATCVHIHSGAILKGKDIFGKIADEIKTFMEQKGYSEVGEFRGMALKSLPAKNDFSLKRARVSAELCTGCGLCAKSCPYDAITMDEKAIVSAGECFGCGFCSTICPTNAISMIGD